MTIYNNNSKNPSGSKEEGLEQTEDQNLKISVGKFSEIEMTVGEIIEAECVPDTDRLLNLKVDLGEKISRQIISGIATFFESPQDLIGKKCVFVTNLAPRTIRGLESNGMILAAHTEDGSFSLVIPEKNIVVGTRIG